MNPEAITWHLTEKSPSFHLAEEAAFWALTKKATEILLLDLRGRSDVCDFFLICTGLADVQVKAIAKAVRDGLEPHGHRLLHSEGLAEARWALLDYVDLVVHIFLPETRAYYLLERLWGDAPRVAVDEAYFTITSVRQRHSDLPVIAAGGSVALDNSGSDTR